MTLSVKRATIVTVVVAATCTLPSNLYVYFNAGAVPKTMIIAQNTITDLYCPGSTSSIFPKWNISGGMIQGDYLQQAEFLKEVLNIEIYSELNSNYTVINLILRINGSVANNGARLECTTDLIEIFVSYGSR